MAFAFEDSPENIARIIGAAIQKDLEAAIKNELMGRMGEIVENLARDYAKALITRVSTVHRDHATGEIKVAILIDGVEKCKITG